jgi:hypothetical protein
MDKEYLMDDLYKTGTDRKDLEKILADFDQNTKITKFNFSESFICHYFGEATDYANDKFCVTVFRPGNEFECKKVKLGNAKGPEDYIYVRTTGSTKRFSIQKLKKEGVSFLADEMSQDEGRNGTMFYFQELEDETMPHIYFTSYTLSRTFPLRMNMPMEATSTLARDLSLSCKIGNSMKDVQMYVTTRTSGKYGKMFAFFAKYKERIPFGQTANEALSRKDADLINWTVTQDKVRIIVSYKDECRAIAKKYPHINKIPMHIFDLSDTGATTGNVYSAWGDIHDPQKAYFVFDSSDVTDSCSYSDCLNDSFNKINAEAAKMEYEATHTIDISSKSFMARFNAMLVNVNYTKVVGKKARNAVAAYARDKAIDNPTILYFKNITFDAIRDEVIESDYGRSKACDIVESRIFGEDIKELLDRTKADPEELAELDEKG